MALIECSECGKQVSSKAVSCPACGNPINDKETSTGKTTIIEPEGEYIACPKCSSKDLHAERKGFSLGKAFAGVVLTGGIGLLAGTIGSKDTLLTCLKCGNKFKAGAAKIIKTGGVGKDLEDRVMSLLRNGDLFAAKALYKKETNCSDIESGRYIYNLQNK